MSILHTLYTWTIKLTPVLIILALMPVLLAFDSIMYWVTRPTCLNCGSLTGFLQNGSLSVFVVSNYIGELGIGGYSFGKKKK